jgi:hypothetical protein
MVVSKYLVAAFYHLSIPRGTLGFEQFIISSAVALASPEIPAAIRLANGKFQALKYLRGILPTTRSPGLSCKARDVSGQVRRTTDLRATTTGGDGKPNLDIEFCADFVQFQRLFERKIKLVLSSN